jgi:phosphoenolpyruvate carboxylase
MNRLIKEYGLAPEAIYKALCSQTVDLVLTAHPTQASNLLTWISC